MKIMRYKLSMSEAKSSLKLKLLLIVWYTRVKWLIFQLFVTSLLVGVLLWISVFAYGAFYYFYMPAVVHERPVYFKFRTNCANDERVCGFPSAELSLMKNSRELLVSGQPYVVRLELEMPESNVNQQIGMFMVHIEFYSNFKDVVYSADHSAMLCYKSLLFRTLETIVYFFPSLVIGSTSQRQTVSVELSDNFVIDPYRPAVGTSIEIQAKHIDIYGAVLKIHAKFTGLRYLLYNWPVFSAFCGITCNFCFLFVAALFYWCSFSIRSFNDMQMFVKFEDLSTTPKLDRKFDDLSLLHSEDVKSVDSGSVSCPGSGDRAEDIATLTPSLRLRSTRT